MIWTYIILMIVVTNLIRVIPMTIIRKRITNPFLCGFLYYVPYVTLSVMTFPAIMDATSCQWIGLVSLVAGIIAAWRGLGLFVVSIICCSTVFILELFV